MHWNPAAQGGSGGVDLVAVDGGIGDRHAASGRVDATPLGVAWFLVILLEETISVPWLAMPPPSAAELPLTVQLVSVAAPCSTLTLALNRPPPCGGGLPLTVQLVSVAVPPGCSTAAAVAAGGVAADGAVGQRGRAVVVLDSRRRFPAEFPLTVQLVSVAVPSCFTGRRRCSGGVSADGAVGQRGRAGVVQAAAVVGGVAADSAVGQRGRAAQD